LCLFILFATLKVQAKFVFQYFFMPLFYQQDINENSKLGIWQIREPEEFFLRKVSVQRTITHPHKRLQHLAGRYLLKYLFADFPYDLIRIADTLKPFLQNEAYHFSISHCGDFAAALVSSTQRVGVDIEMATPKIEKVLHKFLNEKELGFLISSQSAVAGLQSPPNSLPPIANGQLVTGDWRLATLLWSAKESVFKWYGDGGVDFSDQINLETFALDEKGIIMCRFNKEFSVLLRVNYKVFNTLCLSWVVSDHTG
jgi:phosphopantetheinyl transferase